MAPSDPVYAEADAWLALAKPPGVPVFPPHDDPAGDCLLARLLAARPEQVDHAWPDGFAGGLAHRLDVPTSGLVLAARDPGGLDALRAAFASGRLRKRYLFLTRKDVPWDQHRLDLPLAHDRRHKRRMVVQRGRDTPHRGRWFPASTTLRRGGPTPEAGPDCRLWHAEIRTGVTHQVRVHAAFAGLALAGDRLYGGGPPLPCDPLGSFLLHHEGLSGLDQDPPALAPPPTWPSLPPHGP
ncbi:MAG: RNA pseudouridine synthase [Alphaproteobacteria bacterium]|nr:RNA pseudouridine synthase [Alphaproteobacteria bacterium]